jgi:hypothetical protein
VDGERRITGKAFSLEALFHGRVTYAIEYYQREYAWGHDEVSTLITDLVGGFERTSGSRRSRWAPPVQYFLGPFVYADEDGNDRRFLVDGQQRFTTLHLIFLHLLRMAPDDTRPKTRHRLTNAVVAGYDGEVDERDLVLGGTHGVLDVDAAEQLHQPPLHPVVGHGRVAVARDEHHARHEPAGAIGAQVGAHEVAGPRRRARRPRCRRGSPGRC